MIHCNIFISKFLKLLLLFKKGLSQIFIHVSSNGSAQHYCVNIQSFQCSCYYSKEIGFYATSDDVVPTFQRGKDHCRQISKNYYICQCNKAWSQYNGLETDFLLQVWKCNWPITTTTAMNKQLPRIRSYAYLLLLLLGDAGSLIWF